AELGSSETLMVYVDVEQTLAMVSPAPLSGFRYRLRVALAFEPPLLQAVRHKPASETPRASAVRRERPRRGPARDPRRTDPTPVADGSLISSPWSSWLSRGEVSMPRRAGR